MASLNDVVKAVAATLTANIPGLSAYEYVLPTTATFPAVMIQPGPGDYTPAFGAGDDKWVLTIFVLTGAGTDQAAAQIELNSLITGWGPSSIRKVLFNNSGLGLTDGTDVMATGVSNYGGKYTIGDVEAAGALIRMLVHTDSRQFVVP
jgi:hypothetical protein